MGRSKYNQKISILSPDDFILRDYKSMTTEEFIKNFNEMVLKKIEELTHKNKKPRKVEVSDKFGYKKVFNSICDASKEINVSTAAIIYCLNKNKLTFKRRCDQKIFSFKEVFTE